MSIDDFEKKGMRLFIGFVIVSVGLVWAGVDGLLADIDGLEKLNWTLLLIGLFGLTLIAGLFAMASRWIDDDNDSESDEQGECECVQTRCKITVTNVPE